MTQEERMRKDRREKELEKRRQEREKIFQKKRLNSNKDSKTVEK